MDLLTHLETFCEVADQKSFTRAAEALGVPQPVVSRRVGALERRLGGRLLVRGPRGVGLTDLGRAVLPHAHGLRTRAEHLAEVARTFHDGVVVAVPPGADPRALVAARTAAHDAGAAATFVEAAPDARAAMLADGSAQAAVTACPPDEADLGAPLGAATTSPDGGRLHLDDLRRGRGEREARATTVHLGVEDDVPWVRDALRRHAAGAGLAAGQVAVGGAVLAAVTDVIEHGDLLVATRAEAERHGLAWRPVAGLDLWRGYQVTGGGPDAEVLRAVVPALARALGLAPGARR
ncbi:LysR family transcriptional regulator [Solicola sp. PLA-1-18]|uniref:LysR family transcriptional regulator n=1 Tax=Solicola sp. PLA-1-18 TaxID=3380532 RepID=UPI003B7904E7